MALTDQEKADVVFHLGWPGRTIIAGTTSFSNIIKDRVDVTNGPILVQIRVLLSRVRAIDLKLQSATSRLSASKIDDIELNKDELTQLRTEKRAVLKELAVVIDIPLLKAGNMGSVCV